MLFQVSLVTHLGPGPLVHALAFLLTYLVHSVVWTVAAAVFTRRKLLPFATQHLYWRTALLAPLVTTALVALCAGGVPAPGSAIYIRPHTVASFASAAGAAAINVGEDIRAEGSWRKLSLLGAAAPAALGLLRFLATYFLLSRRLRGRRRLSGGRCVLRLERMRARTNVGPVVLTESGCIDSPMIVGGLLGPPEICIPRTLSGGLTDAELDTVFAHELAHIERRDGFWFPIVGLVQSIFLLQPLNHWVGARIRQTAELACDDRAVALTADPMSLARALTEVAAGALSRHSLLSLPGMAGTKRMMFGRVQRLVQARDRAVPGVGGARQGGQVGAGGWAWFLCGSFVIALVAVCLGVQPAQARRSPPAIEAASERMMVLAAREHLLRERVEAARHLPDAAREGSAAFALVLDLRQELRHVGAMQAWTERRFVDEWTAWEQLDAERAAKSSSGRAP